MRRRRVLAFLYYFPPSGGPGVLRGLKFVKYLPDSGFDPAVVTVREETFDDPQEYAPDPSTLAEVPPEVPVHRVRSGRPVRLERLLVRAKLMRLAQLVLYPLFWERQALWPLAAIRKGREILDREGADLVYTCSGPFASNLIGLSLSASHGVPWVADHRDPWTGSWSLHWPTRAHHRIAEHVENRVLARTSRFVANTPGQRRELLRRFPSADPRRIAVVPNGYDEEDFASLDPPPPEEDFVVLHAGSFEARGRGTPSRARRFVEDRVEYRNRHLDVSSHSPRDLFLALSVLDRERPEVFRRIRVDLVGAGGEPWRREAERIGVGERVRVLPPEPHRSAVRRMLGADLLFLPATTRRDGGPVSRVSQKLYEYLRAGRPILLVGGPGDAADIVREAGAGVVVPAGRPRELADRLRGAVEGELRGLRPRGDVVRRFDRRLLTARLAEVFRAAATERRGSHGR